MSSAVVAMTVDIVPVVDAPSLALSSDGVGASQVLFRTDWETAPDLNSGSTLVQQSTYEGWTLVTSPDGYSGGKNGFEFWSEWDEQADASGTMRVVTSSPGDNWQWLELNNASGTNGQTLGIARTVSTQAGATYKLCFDYAGRMGFSAAYTRIAVYVDDVKIGSYANTSTGCDLNWLTAQFEFTGNGSAQTIKLVTDATTFHSGGRGANLDNIVLTEKMPVNSGYANGGIRLSNISASLVDTDGSETLSVVIKAVPVGATLTDGCCSFTASAGNTTTNVSGWNLSCLSIKPAANFVGSFDLQVVATAKETATGATATGTANLTVKVVAGGNLQSPLVLDLNGDGIHTVALADATGRFDLLNTGAPIRSGWLSADDGFLAVDRNGNGRIDDRSELFGGQVGEGYAQLARYDSNGDGGIDRNDLGFSELLIWQDANSNHQTDAGELHRVDDMGIAALRLTYQVQPELQNGNLLLERGFATRADGRTMEMADVYFRVGNTEDEKPRDKKARPDASNGAPRVTRPLPPESANGYSLNLGAPLVSDSLFIGPQADAMAPTGNFSRNSFGPAGSIAARNNDGAGHTGRPPEPRSASIIIRSEQPAQRSPIRVPGASEAIAVKNADGRPTPHAAAMNPGELVIDWDAAGKTEPRSVGRPRLGQDKWLADFLGMKDESRENLALVTGLKITLGAGGGKPKQ